jgi:DNA-binding NarL/FixJ family response regulator
LEIADLALTPAKHSLVLDGPVATKAQLADLTPRQQDVLRLLRDGKSNKEMARILSLGAGTVKVHVAAVLRSLGVPNRTAAASIAVQLLDER